MADAQTAVLDSGADVESTSPENASSSPPETHVVVSHGLSESSRSRLAATGGIEVIDDVARIAEAELVVVSTRLAATETTDLVEELSASFTQPIVAVVHPGGESVAVDLLSAGASALVAEGNESSVVSFLGSDHDPSSLIEFYGQSLDKRSNGSHKAAGDLDPVTRLRGQGAFEARLSEPRNSVPRLAVAKLVGFEVATRRLSMEARDLLRRRIALQCEQLCRDVGADLYSSGPSQFAVIADSLSVSDFERLAGSLITVVHGYSPDRSAPLRLAVGHAGPEAATGTEALVEFAARGADLAEDSPEGTVVGAEQLTLSLAASTELDSMMRAVALVEERDSHPGSHGERVARLAVAIGEAMDIPPRSLIKLRLAGRLHDVGKLDLSEAALAGNEESLEGAQLAEYRSHAVRGAQMLRAIAGPEVAEVVRYHHERWDGSGFPDGVEAGAIPVGARILAAADALDRWSTNGTAPDRPTSAALQKLTEAAGSTFDPAVVEACVRLFGPV